MCISETNYLKQLGSRDVRREINWIGLASLQIPRIIYLKIEVLLKTTVLVF